MQNTDAHQTKMDRKTPRKKQSPIPEIKIQAERTPQTKVSRVEDSSAASHLSLSQNSKTWIHSGDENRQRRISQKLESTTNVTDYQQLSTLRQAFLDRWNGQDLGLTKKEFQVAARQTIKVNLSEKQLDTIFQQMDMKETGLIRWCDYITSISQTAQLRAYMAAQAIKPLFQDKMKFITTKHRDEIISIRFIPRLSLQSTKINYTSGRYLMLGRQGHITMWTLNLCLISTFYIGATEGLNPLYFVDMVVLYPSTLIAVTSTDRKITLYELGSRGIHEKYSIVTLGNCVTCLDFWSDLRSRTTSLLVWGDTAGDIHALEINVNRLGGIFDKDKNREIISRVVYADLVKHKIPTVHLHRVLGVHDDWVTSVKYIPENKAFLSSSRSSSRQSMLYSDWYGKAESRYYLIDKAVLCFDYNHVINILVTGSLDCKVRVWNFFMGQRPISTLSGHASPITHLSLNAATQHVISVDKSRAIKVFDYMEGTVIQSFSGPSLQCMGTRSQITGFFFNVVGCQLIVANTMLATATKRTNPPYMAEISAHDFPITALCYSSTFQEILTACTNGVISVWDVYTGRHMLQFRHFSSRSQFQDLPWAKDNVRVEVTAMVLDPSQRCAMTGTNDGTVNVWNFSTGVLLSHYTLPDSTLVTGLVVDRNFIYVTGWFRQVYQLDREEKSLKEPPKCFNRYHKEEVNCIALIHGGLLATGSYDGDIIVVARDTGHPMCRMNAGESQLPLPMRLKMEDVEVTEKNILPESERVSSASTLDYSEDEMFSTEDHSILRGIRITKDLVMVSNPITGEAVRIVRKPKVDEKPDQLNSALVFDPLQGKNVTKEESAAAFRAYESSVEALLCLQTRKHLDIHTASLVSAGAEGWIRAWSLNPKGGLKGQFLATEYLGEAVKAMATDQDNDFLITGDTRGYIKIWDIFPYCNAAAKRLTELERQQRRDRFTGMFIYLRSPFLRDKASEGFKACQENHKRHPPEISNPSATLKTPTLLSVYRAHMQAIACIQYVDELRLILSGGKDCSVRIWTLRGSFVGQCGAPWVKLPDPSAVRVPLRVLPGDIRRNASARTFRVIKSGNIPLWDHAMHCVKNYLEEQRKDAEKKAELEARKEEALARGEQKEKEADSMLTQPVSMGKEEPELPEDLRLCNVVRFNWQDPKKSCILGKSFRPTLHHLHPSVPLHSIEDDFGMYPAYRMVKVVDIDHITRIPTPQMVKDMEIRRREEEEDAQKWRQMRKKSKMAKSALKTGCSSPSRKDRKASQQISTATAHLSVSFSDSSSSHHAVINKSITDTLDANANASKKGDGVLGDTIVPTTTGADQPEGFLRDTRGWSVSTYAVGSGESGLGRAEQLRGRRRRTGRACSFLADSMPLFLPSNLVTLSGLDSNNSPRNFSSRSSDIAERVESGVVGMKRSDVMPDDWCPSMNDEGDVDLIAIHTRSFGQESCTKEPTSSHSDLTKTAESDVQRMKRNDLTSDDRSDVMDDTVDIDVGMRDVNNHRGRDSPRGRASGCMLPPLVMSTKEPSVRDKSCIDFSGRGRGPESHPKTPKLPVLWTKRGKSSLFKGTGLSFGW